jgi:hypothetical protein
MVGSFHPATRRLKEIVDSGEIGILTKIETSLAVPSGLIDDGNIRMVYDLGGGVMMDNGCEFDQISCESHIVSYDSSSQATLCPCRGTYQAPIPRRSSVLRQTYFRSSLWLI